MRETGPAIITPSGVPADRRDAAALALETRRAYHAALGRHEEALAGRALIGHVTALAADGPAPASIAQAVAAAYFFARVAGWPNTRGPMTGDALRIAGRDHRDRGRGQARTVTADQISAIIAVAVSNGHPADAAIAVVRRPASRTGWNGQATAWPGRGSDPCGRIGIEGRGDAGVGA